MKILATLILLFSIGLNAKPNKNAVAYPAAAVGSDAVNTGFENLTCSQMIGRFLVHVGSSGLGPSAIDRRFRACLAQSRSGVKGTIMSGLRMVSDQDRACLEAANQEQKNYEEARKSFIWALTARENIYNVKSVAPNNRNLLRECNSSQSLVRRPGESDGQFSMRIAFSCDISKDVEAFRYAAFRQVHTQAGTYEDFKVCHDYRLEYSREMYPPLNISRALEQPQPSAQANGAAVAAGPNCQPLTCEQVMLPYAVSNPSPCYRNRVIDCNISGYSAPVNGSAGGGRVSTGN